MARKIATNTVVSRDEPLDFIRPRHHAIVITARGDDGPQASPVTCGVDDEGRIVIATYPEHPDRAEYREAMVKQGKSLLRVTPDRRGPVATGGFPARLG